MLIILTLLISIKVIERNAVTACSHPHKRDYHLHVWLWSYMHSSSPHWQRFYYDALTDATRLRRASWLSNKCKLSMSPGCYDRAESFDYLQHNRTCSIDWIHAWMDWLTDLLIHLLSVNEWTECRMNGVSDVQVAGTHGTVRLDEFVIPYRPDKASFLVTNNHGFTELDLAVKTETEERVVSTLLCNFCDKQTLHCCVWSILSCFSDKQTYQWCIDSTVLLYSFLDKQSWKFLPLMLSTWAFSLTSRHDNLAFAS